MNIAIIGWGSLIWNPETLKFNEIIGWSYNGPMLPIEFSRISINGRLTLVISENVQLIKTFFALSSHNNLKDAIKNLKEREGTNKKNIGFYNKINEEYSPIDFKCLSEIKSWINKNEDIDAVIWTNIPENWKNKTSHSNRIEYLSNLDDNKKDIARKYIINTPDEINTELRKDIKQKLNWV